MASDFPWSDLPKELLEGITKYLDNETDVSRFRAVCSSWRSSTAPFKKSPRTPLKLPFFSCAQRKHRGAYFNLVERTVYRVQSIDSKSPRFWLVKVQRSGDGKLRVLNPVSHHQIKIQEDLQGKVLNTLDFRVSEVCSAYALQYVNPSRAYNKNDEYKYVKKVIVYGDFENDNFVVLVIDCAKKLAYIRPGEKKWTRPLLKWTKFLDVVNCNGQFYAIDLCGGTWTFDCSFEAIKVTNSTHHSASNRHLLELHKKLYLVEEVIDENPRVCTGYIVDGLNCIFPSPVKNAALQIKILKVGKGDREWAEVKTEDDSHRIIFVGDDCSFSVSSEEFEGCNGITRVFYADQYICFKTAEEKNKAHYRDNGDDYRDPSDPDYDDGDDDYDYDYASNDLCVSSSSEVDSFVPSDDVQLKFRGLHGHNTGVCDFKSGEIGSLLMFPEYADIFWPPPSWLSFC